MGTYNEEDIINRLQNPESQRKAFEEVVKHYSSQLYWQIRRMVLSHDDANDIFQNTFLKAWSNLNYFRGEAKLSTWLYRSAFNECLKVLNKQRAQSTLTKQIGKCPILRRRKSRNSLPKSHRDTTRKTTNRIQSQILQ